MSFKKFISDIMSVRDYKETRINEGSIVEILAYMREINTNAGAEKGFSFIMMENGQEVYDDLKSIGGYSGVMIKSPHYIGLITMNDDPETEFLGGYYMQSIVKKLYDMNLGSCWITIRNISEALKSKLLKDNNGDINYLLAFGLADENAIKQKTPRKTIVSAVSSYKQDPYGVKADEALPSDKLRNSLSETVYLYEWGKKAAYEELESRGMGDIFFYLRNAPSYKNLQPCRIILKDGEAELAVINPGNEGIYTDAGIMMYTLEGLAKDSGIPGKWHFVRDKSENKEYRIVAKIEL